MSETHSLTSDELAMQRTSMASERTFMAWTRTALSLISFGFAIPKVVQQMDNLRRPLMGDNGPRLLGIIMAGLGVFVLAASSFQHAQLIRAMKKRGKNIPSSSLSYIVASVLFTLGILALLNLLFNFGPL